MIWPKVLTVLGAVYAFGMIVFYARPYQLAVGLVSVDGPYLVWSGELGLALGFGGLFMCGGLFSHWAISRFYASGI